jgi:UDP-N-acetylglucosamine 2-epimerase
MPEEHNRVLTDHCADLLFCPTQTAVENLRQEGVTRGVHEVGDPMYDAVLMFSQKATEHSRILHDLSLEKGCYLLLTIHRAYNTDDPQTLKAILSALGSVGETIVFPVHPRTRQKLKDYDLLADISAHKNLMLIDPIDYLDMLILEQNARMILTDSGGVQKEAFFFAVPCLTLRPETEWVETVNSGWNILVDIDEKRISAGLRHSFPAADQRPEMFGNGHSAVAIARILGE